MPWKPAISILIQWKDTTHVNNVILLNNFLLHYTKNAYNQRGFSHVTCTTAGLSRQMLTTKLPTMHFAIIALEISDSQRGLVIRREFRKS